jgi:hypothetical protein
MGSTPNNMAGECDLKMFHTAIKIKDLVFLISQINSCKRTAYRNSKLMKRNKKRKFILKEISLEKF